ncbi:MAG: hypothetical protein CUN56_00430 [Phototrophicales bacterium]|nr:MAG: hypothetical protein CUN56_00430 [Phototrophicales bacterium]
MSDNKERDQYLAALTDALRAQQSFEETLDDEEMDELMPIVQRLHQMIPPDQGAPSAFRAQLAQRLAEEFDAQRQTQLMPFFRRRWVRLTTLAAVVIALFGVVILLQDDRPPTEGTASGSDAIALLVTGGLLAVFIGVLGIYYYLRHTRSS